MPNRSKISLFLLFILYFLLLILLNLTLHFFISNLNILFILLNFFLRRIILKTLNNILLSKYFKLQCIIAQILNNLNINIFIRMLVFIIIFRLVIFPLNNLRFIFIYHILLIHQVILNISIHTKILRQRSLSNNNLKIKSFIQQIIRIFNLHFLVIIIILIMNAPILVARN